jgi:hypothetical protein
MASRASKSYHSKAEMLSRDTWLSDSGDSGNVESKLGSLCPWCSFRWLCRVGPIGSPRCSGATSSAGVGQVAWGCGAIPMMPCCGVGLWNSAWGACILLALPSPMEAMFSGLVFSLESGCVLVGSPSFSALEACRWSKSWVIFWAYRQIRSDLEHRKHVGLPSSHFTRLSLQVRLWCACELSLRGLRIWLSRLSAYHPVLVLNPRAREGLIRRRRCPDSLASVVDVCRELPTTFMGGALRWMVDSSRGRRPQFNNLNRGLIQPPRALISHSQKHSQQPSWLENIKIFQKKS